MTREERVRNLLTELIDMIDNGSQRDMDRADEIGTSIIKLFKQVPILDKIRAEIPKLTCGDNEYRQALVKVADVIKCIDKYKAESEETDI